MERTVCCRTAAAMLFVTICTVTCVSADDAAVTVELTRAKQALLPVTIAADASPDIRATAADLAKYLALLGGAEITVKTGDGSSGIVLGKPADFTRLPLAVTFGTGPFEREDYVLRSKPNALYLLGSTDAGVSHAAWDLLHHLGYRQFFPGETWEVVPPAQDLKIAIDRRESPSFHARRIWYDWGLWGYNNEPYRQWCRRNRIAKGFDLNSGHAYEDIIAANKPEFDKHPEYYALLNGERKLRPDVKFCISNPSLRRLVVEHARRYFQSHPGSDSISMEPSDGGGWCECKACLAMGSPSDRAVTLANEVAEAVNTLGLGTKYVGMYAYNQHAAPPTVAWTRG